MFRDWKRRQKENETSLTIHWIENFEINCSLQDPFGAAR